MKFDAELRGEVTDGKIRLQAERIQGVPLPDQVVQPISHPIPERHYVISPSSNDRPHRDPLAGKQG